MREVTTISLLASLQLNSTNNGTVTSEPLDISEIVQICFSIILCIVMFGVGCAGDFTTIISHFRHPAGISTGIFNQVIIMPLLALAMVYATQLPVIEAMAVLIQGTAPGGMMSNIISYWVKGDVNLSISMTVVSTVLALGFMPLWLFVFTQIINVEKSLQIPFSQLGIALAIMVVPVVFGAILRRYKPNPAEKITKIFTIFGTVCIIVTLIVSGIVSGLSFHVSWKQWLISFLTPIIGIVIGYLVSLIAFLKLSQPCRRTVAIETGMQNCQISQSVLVISYAGNTKIYEKIRLYPLLNSGFQILWGVLLAIAVRHWIRKSSKYKEPTAVALDEGKNEDTEANNGFPANSTA